MGPLSHSHRPGLAPRIPRGVLERCHCRGARPLPRRLWRRGRAPRRPTHPPSAEWHRAFTKPTSSAPASTSQVTGADSVTVRYRLTDSAASTELATPSQVATGGSASMPHPRALRRTGLHRHRRGIRARWHRHRSARRIHHRPPPRRHPSLCRGRQRSHAGVHRLRGRQLRTRHRQQRARRLVSPFRRWHRAQLPGPGERTLRHPASHARPGRSRALDRDRSRRSGDCEPSGAQTGSCPASTTPSATTPAATGSCATRSAPWT